MSQELLFLFWAIKIQYPSTNLYLALFWSRSFFNRMSGVNKATRVEIIQWLKDTLLVSINKFEEVYNGGYSEVDLHLGAFSCQIIDILFPCKGNASASNIASMPMSKVNFLAKEPFEIQKNYRLIQSVFTAKNVQFVQTAHSLLTCRISRLRTWVEVVLRTIWNFYNSWRIYMTNCMKSVTTIPSSGDSTARAAKVLFFGSFDSRFQPFRAWPGASSERADSQLWSPVSRFLLPLSAQSAVSHVFRPAQRSPETRDTASGRPAEDDRGSATEGATAGGEDQRERPTRELWREVPCRSRHCSERAPPCIRRCRRWRASHRTQRRATRRRSAPARYWKFCGKMGTWWLVGTLHSTLNIPRKRRSGWMMVFPLVIWKTVFH